MLWGVVEGVAAVLRALGSVYDAGAALVRRVRGVPKPPANPLPFSAVLRQKQQAEAGVAADKAGAAKESGR
jgi:hypothetical protein